MVSLKPRQWCWVVNVPQRNSQSCSTVKELKNICRLTAIREFPGNLVHFTETWRWDEATNRDYGKSPPRKVNPLRQLISFRSSSFEFLGGREFGEGFRCNKSLKIDTMSTTADDIPEIRDRVRRGSVVLHERHKSVSSSSSCSNPFQSRPETRQEQETDDNNTR